MHIYVIMLLLFFGCYEKPVEISDGKYKKVSEIPTPDGYTRDSTDKNSFAAYLRNLKFKNNDTVLLYNGKPKGNQDAQYAVIDMEIGNKDLQQCADATIRLRAEFLYAQKRYDDIHFNFTNGDRADYTEYADGYRPVVINNQVKWTKNAEKDYSYKTFRQYLDLVFTYAGTYSLSREMVYVNIKDMEPGDVFIQTGDPYGHAVIVADVATNPKTGQKAFLLIQSYMPAQEMHLLKNPAKHHDPWFYNNFSDELKTPEWTFRVGDLKRFR